MGKNPELLDAMDRVQMIKTVSPTTIFESADDIKALWESEEIKATFLRRNEFQIEECARYFISKVHQVMEKSYVPTDQDMVQTRERTTGIVEHHFQMSNPNPIGFGQNKAQTVILIDVGGQRTERRKWIHCFEDVLILVFLAAVSEYDQVLEEDGRTNRLEESLNLFKAISGTVYFKEQEIILFLNKKDLLEEKIKSGRSPFKKHFPTVNSSFRRWEGADNDYEGILGYMEELFKEQDDQQHEIHAVPTCATDTENISRINANVQSIILKNILNQIGTS